MRAGWSAATIAAAAAVSLGGLGLVIARRLTAPAPPRRFDLVVREVTGSGDERTVVLDRTRQTIEPAHRDVVEGKNLETHCLPVPPLEVLHVSDQRLDAGERHGVVD